MKQFLANNSHEVACRGSQRFANHLINYLNNKLLANHTDPEIALIITFYSAFVNNWNKGYSKWRDAINFEISTTEEMKILEKLLIENKAPEWQGKIYGVYYQGTPKATALLPHGRTSLITGNPINKIAGMNTLIKGIGTDSELQNVKTDLQTFTNLYTQTFQQHQAALKNMKELAKTQEGLRLQTTDAMLGCEGSLTMKFYNNSHKVDLFFDIEAMRQRHRHVYKTTSMLISLWPAEIKIIDMDYTFKEQYIVNNTGTSKACIFFGNNSTIVEIPTKKFVAEAGKSIKIDLSTLPPDMRFIYAANLSKESKAELSIALETSSKKSTTKKHTP